MFIIFLNINQFQKLFMERGQLTTVKYVTLDGSIMNSEPVLE